MTELEMTELRELLARSLGVKPQRILRFQRDRSGYSVLHDDLRKFSGVHPDPTEVEDPIAIMTPNGPYEIPEGLRAVYEQPRRFKRSDVRELATELRISPNSHMTKPQLVDAITRWKEENDLSYE